MRERPGRRVHLEVAHRSRLRLLKLVNSLLDFARIEARASVTQLPSRPAARPRSPPDLAERLSPAPVLSRFPVPFPHRSPTAN
jgi:signal transduction histidine kinase